MSRLSVSVEDVNSLINEFKSTHTHTYTEDDGDGLQDNITLRGSI
jgi:hypothetical protein